MSIESRPGSSESSTSRTASALRATHRAFVTALALGTGAGLLLDVVRPGSAVHPLWMGTVGVPAIDAILAAAFVALVLARRPIEARWATGYRWAARAIGLLVGATCALALARHAHAIAVGRIAPVGFAPPFALVTLVLVAAWTLGIARPPPDGARAVLRLGRATAVAVAMGALVLLQIEAVGATDYRTHADAILVLGSKVNADGRASGSLAVRTRTACALWKSGLAPLIVLSGGRGHAPVGEPEAMREVARAEGVPDSALLLDSTGVNTEASVRFAADLARAQGWRRVLVVSHDYHLARIRLLAARMGLSVRTVPAVETHTQMWKAVAIPREVLAYVADWAF